MWVLLVFYVGFGVTSVEFTDRGLCARAAEKLNKSPDRFEAVCVQTERVESDNGRY